MTGIGWPTALPFAHAITTFSAIALHFFYMVLQVQKQLFLRGSSVKQKHCKTLSSQVSAPYNSRITVLSLKKMYNQRSLHAKRLFKF